MRAARAFLVDRYALVWIAALFFFGNLAALPAASQPRLTSAEGALPRSTPEAQGVSSAGILAFLEAVERQRQDPAAGVELHSLMVIRNGHVLAEGWWAPYAPGRRHMLFSLSKSFTSTAVGLAVDEGRLALDDQVASFFPEELPDPVGEGLAALRVRDLLTMSTGQEQEGGSHPNWIRTFLAHPVVHAPGSTFRYNTMATFMLSAILEKVTGQSLPAYLTPRLFEPLGIKGAAWDVNPQGIAIGGAGLNLKTEDIARFGLLYLQNGVWNGAQVVPAAWVQEATTAHIASSSSASRHAPEQNDWAQGYGYQFWRTTHGAFRGDGAFGQFVVVLPDLDALIVTTAGARDMQAVLDLFWDHLLPAFKDAPLPADAAMQARLTEQLAALTLLPDAGQAASPMAARVSGKTYVLEDNPMQARTLSFQFEDEACLFTLEAGAATHRIPCGLGRWVDGGQTVAGPNPGFWLLAPSSLHIASSGAWTDDTTFVMTWQLVEAPFSDTVTAHFEGETVRLEFSRGMGGLPLGQDARPVLHGRLKP